MRTDIRAGGGKKGCLLHSGQVLGGDAGELSRAAAGGGGVSRRWMVAHRQERFLQSSAVEGQVFV